MSCSHLLNNAGTLRNNKKLVTKIQISRFWVWKSLVWVVRFEDVIDTQKILSNISCSSKNDFCDINRTNAKLLHHFILPDLSSSFDR